MTETSTPTVSDGLGYLYTYHLQYRACGSKFRGNWKALCKTIGHIPLASLTRPQIISMHCERRSKQVGPAALKHDLKWLSLMYNKLREWKEDGFRIDGIDFTAFELPPVNPTSRIKRPRTYPRDVIWSPEEISRLIEHAPDRLRRRVIFAIDTGQSEIDLRRLRPNQYDARRDAIVFIRHKTGEREAIPVSDRCRPIILEAIAQKRDFVLDWTNQQKDLREALRLAKINNRQFRDIRKTSINQVRKLAGRTGPAQKFAIHASPRTTEEHYIISDGEDLRPYVKNLELVFSVGKS